MAFSCSVYRIKPISDGLSLAWVMGLSLALTVCELKDIFFVTIWYINLIFLCDDALYSVGNLQAGLIVCFEQQQSLGQQFGPSSNRTKVPTIVLTY